MKQLQRLALLSMPVLLGILIGVAWCESSRSPSDQASAAEGKPDKAKPDKAKAAKAKPAKAEKHHVVKAVGDKVRAPAKKKQPVRVGSAVGVNRETLDQYVILHKHVWPEVLDRIQKSGIRNYSIYLGELDDGELYLFSYFEYVGHDFEADMEAIANDPVTREWWKLTDPLQKRIRGTKTGAQWKTLEEVFHTD